MLGIPHPTVPLPAGLLIAERWEVGAPLRSGGCNSYLAKDRETGQEVVVKLLAAMPFPVDLVRVEAAVAPLRALEAVFVPRIVGLAEARLQDRHAVVLVQERMAGASLADLVAREGPLPEARVRSLARHLLEALRTAGQREPPLIHGDLSPENVLVRAGAGGVALVDWAGPKAAARDWSSQEYGPNGWSLAVARSFAAPEVPLGAPNPRSDLYGAGACLAFAWTAKAPDSLRAQDPQRVLYTALATSGVPEGLALLLARLLDVTCERRLSTAQEALEGLRDPAALAPDRALMPERRPPPDWRCVPDPAAEGRWAALGAILATLPALPMALATLAVLLPIGFGMRGWVVLVRVGLGLALGELGLLTMRSGFRVLAGFGRARLEAYGRGLRVDLGQGWFDLPWQHLVAVTRRGPLLLVEGTWSGHPGDLPRPQRLWLPPVYSLDLDRLAERLREGMGRAAALAAGQAVRSRPSRVGLPGGLLAVAGVLLLALALVGDRWGAADRPPDLGRILPRPFYGAQTLPGAARPVHAESDEDGVPSRPGLAALAALRPATSPEEARAQAQQVGNPLTRALQFADGARRERRESQAFAAALAEVQGRTPATPTGPIAAAPLRFEEAILPLDEDPPAPAEVPSPPVPARLPCPAGMVARDLAPGLLPTACWDAYGTMVRVPAEGSAAGFLVDWTEVTAADYAGCVAEGACTLPGEGPGCHGRDADAGSLPVNCVEQAQATTWCAWAHRRLCSADEHRRAATGPGGAAYPWGDAPADCTHAVRDGRGTPGASNAPGCGRGGPWPVGSRPAGLSPVGALDLSGNVAEWVAAGGAAGGSYLDKAPEELQAAGLRPIPPDFALPDVGFRCCREVSP